MPSVRDNTKYRCSRCKGIIDATKLPPPPCPSCGGTDFKQIRITVVCDFCSSTENVRWVMPCEDFRAEGIPGHGSIGDWAACDECKALIEADQRDTLARRWLNRDPDARVLPEAVAMAAIRYLHDQFFANRNGEPYLVDDEYLEDTRDPAA